MYESRRNKIEENLEQRIDLTTCIVVESSLNRTLLIVKPTWVITVEVSETILVTV